jgi:hypothetical protein
VTVDGAALDEVPEVEVEVLGDVDAPKTASDVWPAGAPRERSVAPACDIVRPRRSTVTSMSTGPGSTCPANTTVIDRRRCVGASSSVRMALAATEVTRPPWGTSGQFHSAPMSVR